MNSLNNLYSNGLLKKLFSQKDVLGDKIIIETTKGEALTFKDFLLQIDSVACDLVRLGLKRGDTVLFLARPSIASIIYIFAVMRAGGVLALADPSMGKDNFVGRVAFLKPSYVLIELLLGALVEIPLLGLLLQKISKHVPDVLTLRPLKKIYVKKPTCAAVEYVEVLIEDTCDSVIIFTSGTTGVPKGVVHTYGSLLETLNAIEAMLDINQADIFYSSQLHFLLASLISGAKVVLPVRGTFNPKEFYGHIVKYSVTKTFGIPAEYNQTLDFLRKENKILPHTLQTIILGSAPISQGFLRILEPFIDRGTEVLCVYGATEILPIACITLKEKVKSSVAGDLLGSISPGVTVRIVDKEIHVSGKSLFDRYLGFEKKYEHAIGDLGMILNNQLILLGRKKDMIIRKNHNIYPSIYESTISSISGVHSCAMVGVYDEGVADEKIYLVVQKQDDVETDVRFIKRLTKELLHGSHSIDENAMPDKIVCMKVPLSGRTQKIDKYLIKKYITESLL